VTVTAIATTTVTVMASLLMVPLHLLMLQ